MWEQLIPAAIGGVTSLINGRNQARAAREAAARQAAAAREAGRLSSIAGQNAAAALDAEGERSSAAIGEASETAAQGVTNAGRDAAAGFRVSTDEANALLRQVYGDAFDQLAPYREGGTQAFTTLSQLAGPGGEFNRSFTAQDLEMDPGYQFRLAEGQKALERSAAARGSLQSGGTLKALTRYAQGVASDEYGKAFDRFTKDRADRFTMLSSLAGVGLRATEGGINAAENYGNRAAANEVAAGEYGGNMTYRSNADAGELRVRGTDTGNRYRLSTVGDAGRIRVNAAAQEGAAITDAADAEAAGIVGSSNAWGRTLGQLGQLGQSAASTWLRPQTAAPARRVITPRFDGSHG